MFDGAHMNESKMAQERFLLAPCIDVALRRAADSGTQLATALEGRQLSVYSGPKPPGPTCSSQRYGDVGDHRHGNCFAMLASN